MLQNYEYQSDFARKYVKMGRLEGRQEGRQEAQQQALQDLRSLLSTLLRSRHLSPPPERLHACSDKEQLQQWILRAASASTIEEIFGD